VRDDRGEWSRNDLPDGWTVDRLAAEIRRDAPRRYPRVPIVNGFCFAIKRAVREVVGEFDERLFPHGYGEENDFCLRAREIGYTGAIADHVYVHHATSRSYRHGRRRRLSRRGAVALAERHGAEVVRSAERHLLCNLELCATRHRVREILAERESVSLPEASGPRVLFVLPEREERGIARDVVPKAAGMRRWGIDAKVTAAPEVVSELRDEFHWIDDRLFVPAEAERLAGLAAEQDVLVAAAPEVIGGIEPIIASHPRILPVCYLSSDVPPREPMRSRLDPDVDELIARTPDLALYTNSGLVAKTVESRHGVKVERIAPGLDTRVYHPVFRGESGFGPVRVAARVHPHDVSSDSRRTLDLLARLKDASESPIEVHVLGDPSTALPGFARNEPPSGDCHRESQALREAALLAATDVYVDLSESGASVRSVLEAMACGCVPVLSSRAEAVEITTNRVNALLVNTPATESSLSAIRELCENGDRRERMRRAASGRAMEFPLEAALAIEIEWLIERLETFRDTRLRPA
jgi:glycosyltransferase involved in cell wall biosynthesis